MLRVSPNQRHLMRSDGTPFFYLADTAWEMLHRLDTAQTDLYLRTRQEQGFNVIQTVILAELDGLRTPNALGAMPLIDFDPRRPNEAYFAHVDWAIDHAASLGFTIGLLPTWGDKWNRKNGAGPEIFTPDNAFAFGQFIGRRYRDRPIVWILGGDRPVESDRHKQIIRQMALGLREGDGGRHLITFHPFGAQTSSTHFHDEPWLDFNMWQTGHHRHRPTYLRIGEDYARTPTKPCMDGEPCYENMPHAFDPGMGYIEEHAVRIAAYWDVFAGACGHAYGCNEVWQFWTPAREPVMSAHLNWTEALHLPGADQMRHLRKLIESRPMLTRVPDPSIVLEHTRDGVEHAHACRDERGDYAMVYAPTGMPVTVSPRLAGDVVRVSFLNPRTGESSPDGDRSLRQPLRLVCPSSGYGNDWVILLDSVHAGMPRAD